VADGAGRPVMTAGIRMPEQLSRAARAAPRELNLPCDKASIISHCRFRTETEDRGSDLVFWFFLGTSGEAQAVQTCGQMRANCSQSPGRFDATQAYGAARFQVPS
jgi:hypothetical protein